MPTKPGTLRYGTPGQRMPARRRALPTNSPAWRALRQRVLVRDSYTCHVCGGYGDEVDHDDGDDTNNSEGNLKTMCHSDHSKKTARENGGFGNPARPRA